MDYWAFVRQHRELDLPDFDTEVDLAASQLAWKSVFKDRPVGDTDGLSMVQRRQAMAKWQSETERLTDNFYQMPQRVTVDSPVEDPSYKRARDTFVSLGFDEQTVDQSWHKTLQNWNPRSHHLSDDVSRPVFEQVTQEQERIMMKFFMNVNRMHRDQGTAPGRTRDEAKESAIYKAITIFNGRMAEESVLREQNLKFGDYCPAVQEALVANWAAEIKMRSLDLLAERFEGIKEFVKEKTEQPAERVLDEKLNPDEQLIGNDVSTGLDHVVKADTSSAATKWNSETNGTKWISESKQPECGPLAPIHDCDYNCDVYWKELSDDLEVETEIDFSPTESDINRLLFDDEVRSNVLEERAVVEKQDDVEHSKDDDLNLDRGDGSDRGR